jgi:hypothetical protein
MSQQESSDYYIKGFDKGLEKGSNEFRELFGRMLDALTDEVMEENHQPNPKDTRDYYYYRGQVSMLATVKELLLKK